jgi:hypothetical protein
MSKDLHFLISFFVALFAVCAYAQTSQSPLNPGGDGFGSTSSNCSLSQGDTTGCQSTISPTDVQQSIDGGGAGTSSQWSFPTTSIGAPNVSSVSRSHSLDG